MDANKSIMQLGLSNSSTSYAKKMRSLSIRTANGHCVSILNEEQPRGFNSAGIHGYRSTVTSPQSIPEMTPENSPLMHTRSASLQITPTRLPPLSDLINSMSISDHHPRQKLKISTPFPTAPIFTTPSAIPTPLPSNTQVIPRTQAKRKYICSHHNCGKAFTTSGHLSRHYRIHTGEKNYHCLYPGCQSRFSRQDNMMQHYRTHLSPRGRRSRTLRVSNDQPDEHTHSHMNQHPLISAFHPYKRSEYPQKLSPLISSQLPDHWHFF